MTAQFSNSNGGMTRSFSTVHGRSRTTKPHPARQSGSLSGNAQTARRCLAMTHRHGRNINAHHLDMTLPNRCLAIKSKETTPKEDEHSAN
jgi:hypothetical protein